MGRWGGLCIIRMRSLVNLSGDKGAVFIGHGLVCWEIIENTILEHFCVCLIDSINLALAVLN